LSEGLLNEYYIVIYFRLEANKCRGDFLEYVLPPGSGVLASNPGGCREGSIPDIVAKIGNKLAQTLGEC
jgi:hypothetical protein